MSGRRCWFRLAQRELSLLPITRSVSATELGQKFFLEVSEYQ